MCRRQLLRITYLSRLQKKLLRNWLFPFSWSTFPRLPSNHNLLNRPNGHVLWSRMLLSFIFHDFTNFSAMILLGQNYVPMIWRDFLWSILRLKIILCSFDEIFINIRAFYSRFCAKSDFYTSQNRTHFIWRESYT